MVRFVSVARLGGTATKRGIRHYRWPVHRGVHRGDTGLILDNTMYLTHARTFVLQVRIARVSTQSCSVQGANMVTHRGSSPSQTRARACARQGATAIFLVPWTNWGPARINVRRAGLALYQEARQNRLPVLTCAQRESTGTSKAKPHSLWGVHTRVPQDGMAPLKGRQKARWRVRLHVPVADMVTEAAPPPRVRRALDCVLRGDMETSRKRRTKVWPVPRCVPPANTDSTQHKRLHPAAVCVRKGIIVVVGQAGMHAQVESTAPSPCK